MFSVRSGISSRGDHERASRSKAASARASTFSGGTLGRMASWLGLTIRLGPSNRLTRRTSVADFVRCTVGEQFLDVDSAQERQSAFEIGRQTFGVHVLGPGLQRMQAIDAGLDQLLDHAMDRAAGVQDHLVAAAASLFGEPAEPGHDEPIELLRPANQALLRAEIVAEEEPVDQIAGGSRRTARWPRNRTRTPCRWPRAPRRDACAS